MQAIARRSRGKHHGVRRTIVKPNIPRTAPRPRLVARVRLQKTSLVGHLGSAILVRVVKRSAIRLLAKRSRRTRAIIVHVQPRTCCITGCNGTTCEQKRQGANQLRSGAGLR